MRTIALKTFLFLAENQCDFSLHNLLGISRSVMWAHLNELEKELGVAIIDRKKGSSKLTPAGKEFYPYVSKTLRTIEEGIKNILHVNEKDKVSGTISISTTAATGVGWLLPSIKDFTTLHPELHINILASDIISKNIENSVDILMRPLGEANTNIIKKWYTLFHHGLFASKDYLEKNGIPLKPEDLLDNHSILAYGENEFSYFEDINWHIRGKWGLPKLTPSLTINSTSALYKAAEEGLGICSSLEESNSFYSGKLIRVLPQVSGPELKSYFAVKEKNDPTTDSIKSIFQKYFEEYLLKLGIKIHHENI